MTYARRYALSAMLGMVTEDDDDAHLATHGSSASRPRATKHSRQATVKPTPQPSQTAASTKTTHPALAAMPRLDGINYQTASAQDGRLCIVATGNVSTRQQVFKASGFKWSEERKLWWRYADSA